MTANAVAGDREVCLAAGMDDYLSKPIRMPALVGALERCRPQAERVDEPVPVVAAAQPEPPEMNDALDPSAIAGLVDAFGDPEVVAALVDTFLTDAPTVADTIRSAAPDDRHSEMRRLELKRAAHSLKSSSAALGATALSSACADLERSALDADDETLRDLAARVVADHQSACQALQTVVARLRNPSDQPA
jgi:HPt (histidine-containing phosphotransfer) domain-containing protein